MRKTKSKKKIGGSKPTKHIVEVRVKSEPQLSKEIVPVDPIVPKDLEPQKEKGKYTLVNTWLDKGQILAMVQKTQPKFVMQRPARGGGTWSYIPQWYVVKALNFVFGWNWDYESVQEPTIAEVVQLIEKKIDQIWVTGKLTVKDGHGHSIVKTQTGRADIKFRKDSRSPLDIGNDLKAAHSDALKKCASLLGIASDVYGTHELKQEGYKLAETVPQNSPESVRSAGPDHECFNCAEPISEAEYTYSKKLYGKAFCRTHQKEFGKK